MEKLILGNESYSLKKGTYNAMWMYSDGSPALWGSYNPDNRSFYLATPDGTLASGMWLESWDGDYVFQHLGCYNYEYVRKSLQLGIF